MLKLLSWASTIILIVLLIGSILIPFHEYNKYKYLCQGKQAVHMFPYNNSYYVICADTDNNLSIHSNRK